MCEFCSQLCLFSTNRQTLTFRIYQKSHILRCDKRCHISCFFYKKETGKQSKADNGEQVLSCFFYKKETGKQWSEYLLCLAIPFSEYDLHRTKCSITCFIQTLHQFTFRPRCRIQGTPTIHIIISYHIALLAFLHSLNKSFTNSIQPTHPTPAKNTNPIRIIILFGLAARNGTVAGCTTVYTGVIS